MSTLCLFLLMGTRLIYFKGEAQSTSPWYSRVQADGSFLICSEKSVSHFSREGKLLRLIDGKGSGLESLGKVTSAVFDGNRYYISDKANLNVAIFDRDGTFLNKQTLYCWNMLTANHQLFMVDLRAFHPSRENVFALTRLVLNKQNRLEEREHFCETTQLAKDLDFGFRFHTMTYLHDTYYVMSEISNELILFSPKFNKVKTIRVSLPGYVAPTCCPSETDYEAARKFITSQSFIHLIASLDGLLAISYTLPNPDHGHQQRRRVQIIDLEGRPIGPPLDQLGLMIGSYGDEVFFIEGEDRYITQIIAWSP